MRREPGLTSEHREEARRPRSFCFFNQESVMGAHMIYASLPCKLLNMYALINRTSDLKNASGTSGASDSKR
jgi:hypothetical protein